MAKHDISTERLAVRGMRTSLLGMLANLALALTKGVAGLFGHSFALVADGLESLADVVSGPVVYVGLKIAIKPPDTDHPYGHGKAEPFAALVVGILLVAAAVGTKGSRDRSSGEDCGAGENAPDCGGSRTYRAGGRTIKPNR